MYQESIRDVQNSMVAVEFGLIVPGQRNYIVIRGPSYSLYFD